MTVQFAFRKIEATDALKEHIKKKAAKFEKFVSYPMDVHVVLGIDKQNHTAEITCHAEHRVLVAIAKTEDLYESIDMAVHKIETQLRKEREKKKGHGTAHTVARRAGVKGATDVGAEIPHRAKHAEKRLRRVR